MKHVSNKQVSNLKQLVRPSGGVCAYARMPQNTCCRTGVTLDRDGAPSRSSMTASRHDRAPSRSSVTARRHDRACPLLHFFVLTTWDVSAATDVRRRCNRPHRPPADVRPPPSGLALETENSHMLNKTHLRCM